MPVPARRPSTGWLAVVSLGLAVTACGNDDPPPTKAAEPIVRPAADLEVARLDLAGGPDWLAADDRGVWVKHDSGELLLVDPDSRAEVGSVNVARTSGLCQGLGASYGAIWTCSGADVVKVDPESLAVVGTFAVKKQAAQGHLVGAFDRVWVLTSDGSQLVGIDPVTEEVAIDVDLPARCTDVAAGDAGLWLPCAVDDRVLRLDPETGEVLLDLAIDNPVSVAVDHEVWVGTATATLRLVPEDGEVLLEGDAGAAPDGGVALDEESVWVRSGDEFLVRVDRETGDRVEQITADVTSGGDVIVVDGLVWTTAFDDGALFVLDPAT